MHYETNHLVGAFLSRGASSKCEEAHFINIHSENSKLSRWYSLSLQLYYVVFTSHIPHLQAVRFS